MPVRQGGEQQHAKYDIEIKYNVIQFLYIWSVLQCIGSCSHFKALMLVDSCCSQYKCAQLHGPGLDCCHSPSSAGGGLQFSVDLSNDDGSLHVLILNARARYGSGFASLRYNFTFQRQIRIPCECHGWGNYSKDWVLCPGQSHLSSLLLLHYVVSVECSAVLDRGNVVVTCLGAENSQQIVSLQYSINGGTLRTGEGLKVRDWHGYLLPSSLQHTAASVSMFTIDQRYFVDGWNNITLIVTGESGESRDFILRFQSSPGESCIPFSR